jgi:hypothetical protein
MLAFILFRFTPHRVVLKTYSTDGLLKTAR